MNKNLAATSALLISAALLFASTSAGFIPAAFGQMPQTNKNDTMTAMEPPEIMPVNQTEAKEILDNLYEARQAMLFGQELEALKHLGNIESILTGIDVITTIAVMPRDGNIMAETNQTETSGSMTEETMEEYKGADAQNKTAKAAIDESTLSSSQSAAQITPVQMNMSAAQDQDTRTFKVTFEKMDVNVDHDLVFEGEWLMDVYVNSERLELFPGSVSVGDYDTYTFDQNNEITVTVSADRGHLWITTAGWENDVGYEPLPVLTPEFLAEISPEDEVLGDIGVFDDDVVFVNTFAEYTRAIQSNIAEHTAGLGNDPNGVVKKAFYTGQDFAGQHNDCSEPNEFAVDNIRMSYEQTCDFVLYWNIEEVQ